jgi:6,7-dimethyl-8-ribityllumazine synthase
MGGWELQTQKLRTQNWLSYGFAGRSNHPTWLEIAVQCTFGGTMQVIEGHLDAQGLQFALVVSRFNEALTSRLESGAVDCLIRHGAEDGKITIVRVPGAWEIPMVAARLAGDGGFDAVICVGALVRGGTAHFDLLAAEVAKGVAQAAISSGVPMTFGVITADTLEQAVERAGTKMGNKGWEAALAAIEMARLSERLSRRL